MWPALIAPVGALVGVVVGAVLAFVFGRRNQTAQSLHQARLTAYAGFAGAAMEYRRVLMDRWFVRNEAGAATDGDSVYAARSALWAALFEVQLLSRSAAVPVAAQAAVDVASALKEARDRPELVRQADALRTAVAKFVEAGRADVTAAR